MEKPERPQTARSESEPKRLKYRSPGLARLGKLADVTLAVANTTPKDDGGQGQMHKTG